MRRRKLSIVGAFACASMAAFAQEPPPREQVPFRAGVEAVPFDVSVVDDDGQPISDLGTEDFTVSVGGEPRRVVSAAFLGNGERRGTQAGGPPSLTTVSTNDGTPGGRMVVFVMDQGSLEQSEVRQVSDVAGRLVAHLTTSDRSALVQMPVGSGIPFTSDHERVLQALKRSTGLASMNAFERNLGLDEVRAIAGGDFVALKTAASRECASEPSTLLADGVPSGAGQNSGGTQQGTGQNGSTGGANPASAFDSLDPCTRRLQFDATSTWHQLHAMSLASMTALRTVLRELKKIPGPKYLILVSGGWPLEMREASSEVSPLAQSAADAGVTIYTLFATSSENAADRRTISNSPLADQSVRRWPLQTLAGMTGGGSFRVDVGSASILDRIGRELAATYRIGVERSPNDFDGRSRALRVDVGRRRATVRAPERFVTRSYADRDLPARLDAALTAPMASTGLGMRLTSYLTANRDAPNLMTIMLVGDVLGLEPGEAKIQVLLQTAAGRTVQSAVQPLGPATAERLPFTTSVNLEPGRYIVRAAVMDAGGHVGSVDHPIDAAGVSLGDLRSGDLLLARLPRGGGESEFLLDAIRPDERLAFQLDLIGAQERVSNADVVFEIASSDDGPALVTSEATFMHGSSSSGLAQALADVRLLPPGSYVARARVRSGGELAGVVKRPFLVVAVPSTTTVDTRAGGNEIIATPPSARLPVRPPFTSAQVLSTPVLGHFLDRLASRSDASSPAAATVIGRLREEPPADVDVPEALVTEAPVVAHFAIGLNRFARGELDPAAREFRAALRASADFYPAMIYLGACFAAGGKDNEAAGAWQTSLIKEGDAPALHGLLVDALLRLGRNEAALAAAQRARTRWPDDPVFARHYVMAALAAGRMADALSTLDQLPGQPEDEGALVLGLQALYEASAQGRPIQDADADRTRLLRYAETYRRIEGPSMALVDAWVSAATKSH
jgi:VWFA-related protein